MDCGPILMFKVRVFIHIFSAKLRCMKLMIGQQSEYQLILIENQYMPKNKERKKIYVIILQDKYVRVERQSECGKRN